MCFSIIQYSCVCVGGGVWVCVCLEYIPLLSSQWTFVLFQVICSYLPAEVYESFFYISRAGSPGS